MVFPELNAHSLCLLLLVVLQVLHSPKVVLWVIGQHEQLIHLALCVIWRVAE